MERRIIRITIETERTLWLLRVPKPATDGDATPPPSRVATEPESDSAETQLETKLENQD